MDWLKRYLPRGLYGRAALILLVPIVAIQLIVSAAFIQRYFEDVTEQMTSNLSIELAVVLARVEAAEDLAAALAEVKKLETDLSFEIALPYSGTIAPRRAFFDLSGIVVERSLRDDLPGLGAVDLGDDQKFVRFDVATKFGPMLVSFGRHRVSAANPHQLLVIMVLAGVLLTLVAYLFLRNQLRPIKRLARAAEAFGKGRNIAYQPSGALEVRAAGNAFLDMRNRIERQMEQRTLMLSGVSHDLRTPLTRMKLGLSMMEQSDETNALTSDVEDMEALIGAFLDFARGDVVENTQLVDPHDLARELVEDATRMGKSVALAPGSGEGMVPLRPMAVRRALDNLIGNATRYGTTALLSVALSERAIRFSVEDDGPGIPAEQREEALQPFARLEPGRNQNRGSGVGLGLSIAFDIARSHGGILRLGDSESLGGLKAELVLAR